jgi:prepilin-type N-terminal cleavage/methylation domain-containing protein
MKKKNGLALLVRRPVRRNLGEGGSFSEGGNNAEGFTLLEMIVVAAVLAVLSVVFTQVFLTTMRANIKTEALKNVKQNGDHAIEVMTRMIQNSRSITTTCFDESEASPSATEKISIIGWDGGVTTLQCKEDGTVTHIASSSSDILHQYLTGNDVTLAEITYSGDDMTVIRGIRPTSSTPPAASCINYPLRFFCLSKGGEPVSIDIFFMLQQASHATRFEEAFMGFGTTVGLRN